MLTDSSNKRKRETLIARQHRIFEAIRGRVLTERQWMDRTERFWQLEN